jgi:hypothetical protein
MNILSNIKNTFKQVQEKDFSVLNIFTFLNTNILSSLNYRMKKENFKLIERMKLEQLGTSKLTCAC